MSKTMAHNKSLLETRLHFQQSEANNAKLFSVDGCEWRWGAQRNGK